MKARMRTIGSANTSKRYHHGNESDALQGKYEKIIEVFRVVRIILNALGDYTYGQRNKGNEAQ